LLEGGGRERDTEGAMSAEHVELVRRHIEAFTRDAAVALSFLDPYVVFDITRVNAGVIGSPSFGHEAIAKEVRRYLGAFEEYRYEVGKLTDLGSGAIVAVVHETARGKTSGAAVQRTYATLYTVIDRKIARITVFPSEREALEAAGLSD